MKEGITSLDLFFLVKQLREKLIDGKIRGIKQIDKTFIFEMFKNEKFFLKIILPTAIYTTTVTQQAPETPPNFCMLLRKHMLNKTISDVRQHEFDRIIEIDLDGYHLFVELFSTGNLVLTDNKNMILGILEQQVWKDRTLKSKIIYKYPPSNLNPFKYEFFEFQKMLKQIDKDLVRGLAVDFGFGGVYAEHICEKTEVDKNKNVSQLNQQEADKLFRFVEQLKNLQVKPTIILEEKGQIDVVPLDLTLYQNNKKIQFDSLGKAIEAYFEGLEKIKSEEKGERQVKEQIKKTERIQAQQKNQLEKLQAKEEKYKKIGQILYEKYSLFNDILNGLNQLIQSGRTWSEIKELIKSQDTEESKSIKEVREDEAKIVIVSDSIEIELDFRKSVEDNANFYFEEAKIVKQKIDALQKAMEQFKPKPEVKIEKSIVRKKWYERYRWFTSSNGILVIAGKNAKNNETIIKRYTRPQDLVLHVDIHGSPFAIIRNDEKLQVIPAETIYEAAEFASTYSKSWEQKLSPVSVYYIAPQQVVKEPGLPTGSFMIKGERKWLEKIKPRLSIGIKQEETFKIKLIYGPPTAVKKQTPYIVTITLGDRTADELTKEIKQLLLSKVPYEIKNATEQIDLEEIKKLIPYGKGELIR